MKRVVKPAGEVNPGDVVLGILGHEPYFDPFFVLLVSHDGDHVRLSHSSAETPPWSVTMQCDVLEGAYTLTQLHATRLAHFAGMFSDAVESGDTLCKEHAELRDLIALVRPPAPVTVDEVLYALQLVTEMADTPGLSGQKQTATDILDRARRAGQLS